MLVNPLVSIIVPTYNRAHLIGETLDSVIAQTYTNWECIVVDDGSTDNTLDVLSEYSKKNDRIQYDTRPSNRLKGANACRNIGIDNSKGEYVIFLDSDDLLGIKCVENRIIEFKKNTNKGLDFIVFSMGHFENIYDLYVDEKRVVFNNNIEETIKQFLTKRFPWNTTRPIYKISILKKIKGFNEKLMRLQDPELALRLLLLIPNVKYKSIDITDCYYRVDENFINKYKNLLFINKGVENLITLLEGLPLSNKQIILFRKELILFFIGNVISYSKLIPTKTFKKALKGINKIVNFSTKEKMKLWIYFVIKRNEHKRGTYRILQSIKSSFS